MGQFWAHYSLSIWWKVSITYFLSRICLSWIGLDWIGLKAPVPPEQGASLGQSTLPTPGWLNTSQGLLTWKTVILLELLEYGGGGGAFSALFLSSILALVCSFHRKDTCALRS